MSTWACAACTFLNDNSAKQCVICEAPKPSGSGGKMWNCGICTFQNASHKALCDMCGSPKPEKSGPGSKPKLTRQKSAGQIQQENMLKLNDLFSQFEGEGDDKGLIADEKFTAFGEKIGIPENSRNVFVLAWKLDAETYGEFTRQEFVDGFTQLDCHDVETIKKWVMTLEDELKDKKTFSEFYKWAFTYAKDPDAKTMARDFATQIWELILEGTYSGLTDWIEFLQSEECELRSVSVDLWNNVLDFIFEVKDDLSNFDTNDNWHSSIDVFVEQLQEKRET